jgi:hypothetical protein
VNQAASSVWSQDPRETTRGTPCANGGCDYMMALKDWRKIINKYHQVPTHKTKPIEIALQIAYFAG